MDLAYQSIKSSLDQLHDQYSHEVTSDPIQFPIRFANKNDREIIAFISALYAFGNVKMIFNTLENFLQFLGKNPYQKIKNLDPKEFSSHQFVQHRWISPNDTKSFLILLRDILLKHGSLENSFMQFYNPADVTIEQSMAKWMEHLQSQLHNPKLTRGQKFLLSSPSKGSTSKRIVMFFRWMVRQHKPDLGLWKKISPSQLLMPLDAHLFRFSQYLGFTKRKQHGWKAVVEATSHFRKIDPKDPTRYDFALARLGILDLCTHEVKKEKCSPCLIRNHCNLFKRSRKAKSFDLYL